MALVSVIGRQSQKNARAHILMNSASLAVYGMYN